MMKKNEEKKLAPESQKLAPKHKEFASESRKLTPKFRKLASKHKKLGGESEKLTRKSKKFNSKIFFYVVFMMSWLACVFIAVQFLIAMPMKWILGDKAARPFWVFVYYLLNYVITLSILIFGTPKFVKWAASKFRNEKREEPLETGKTTLSELGMGKLPTFIDIGLVPVAYVAHAIIASILTTIMQLFSWYNAEQAQDVGFSYYLGGWDRIFAMLAIVFIAPIAEEIMMRGWLYGKLRGKLRGTSGVVLSILLVSLLFSLLHGQWNVSVTVFGLSAILCLLREITGTVWSGMLLHILSNGIAFYILYIAQMM